MSDMFNRLADLSPQKRELLTKLLQSRGVDLSRLPIVPRGGDRSSAVLSFAQQRLWFLNQLEPGAPFYNVPTIVRFEGALDVTAFERALNGVVQRHEALRTVFPIVEGQPVQMILPTLTVPLRIVEDVATSAVRELGRAEIQHPFDLAQGPLLRALLLRMEPQSAADMHVLVLTMHHIVSDGWSMKLFIQELTALYHAFTTGAPPALAELPIQYADYAVWQRQWMQGELLETQLAYWRQQLGPTAGTLPTLNLPTDHPRPPVQSFRGGRHMFTLPKTQRAALAALAQSENATMFMLLLAAFNVLLHRYSRQDDIVIGSPVAGRHRLEIEGLIGCFINTLVLRTDLSGDPSFRELLARVRRLCVGAYAHQDLPFEKLVEELQPSRDLSRQPLFQAMFILQDDPLTASEMPRLALQPLVIETGTSQFDLTLSVIDSPDGLLATLEYNSELFELATIERMAGHLQNLLDGIVQEPAQRLSALPLLTAAERQQVLRTWNATEREYATDASLHELIAHQAQRTPSATAVIFDAPSGQPDATQLSYAELDGRANQLAHHLRAIGVGPEMRVGVCMERSIELVVALLAVLKAGGAYVPLDPSYPAARLQFMLEDAQTQVLLVRQQEWTAQGEPSGLDQRVATLVYLDADWPTIAEQPITAPVSGVDADHPAYVIYTSGSTGRPKGAINTHRAIRNRLLWMQDAYGLTAADRVLQKTPFSFDVSVWEFFWPLLTGATLVVARPEGHKDPAYLAELIQRQQISTLHFVPSMLRLFLEQPDLARCTSLKRVICSGEALPLDVQERCLDRLQAELHNLYGPTEAAVDVTAWACRRDSGAASVPIGRPISNTQIYILDERMEPVPVGVPGELYIGGVQLARGYLHRAALTAEKFVPDPFGAWGARLYRTGDLARYAPDGAIEFLGRIDHQVKIRGFRVEPGEIEAALVQHQAILAAAVVVRGTPNDARLVAYVVGEPRTKNQEPGDGDEGTREQENKGTTEQGNRNEDAESRVENQESGDDTDGSRFSVLGSSDGSRFSVLGSSDGSRFSVLGSSSSSSELRAFLGQRLPEYMIPSVFVPLAALPLTPNGKLDLGALPELDGARPAPEATYVAPQTDVEQQIAAIWQAVLEVDQVGVHDNFFDLGGHSLLLIQVHRRLAETLTPNLTVVELFQNPTISALARHLAKDQPAQSSPQQAQERAANRLDTMRQQRQFRQRSQSTKKPPR